MALDAEAAQHTISAHIALRIAISDPGSTAVFTRYRIAGIASSSDALWLFNGHRSGGLLEGPIRRR